MKDQLLEVDWVASILSLLGLMIDCLSSCSISFVKLGHYGLEGGQ